MKIILHIDFNSYFASVEQQANPRLRGKPIGVTGGDRMERTVLGAASVEAKRCGVKTGMQVWEAQKLCPQIIIVPGDSDKYLYATKRFLNILKDYSPYLKVFSIDEAFLEVSFPVISSETRNLKINHEILRLAALAQDDNFTQAIEIALKIKARIKAEIGEVVTCSIGISYNKLMAKLAGSLQKPDGLVVIPDQKTAVKVLDKVELDEICGIGPRIKERLNNMGICNFHQLRKAPLPSLLAAFKSYGQILYNMARGIDYSEIVPFYEKAEVKSVGHRHTINHDTDDPEEIKQILLKLTEVVARRLRAKSLVGKTVHCWYRLAFHLRGEEMPASTRLASPKARGEQLHLGGVFDGASMQVTISYTNDGLEIFKAAWRIFHQIWNRDKIRMIGVSISNLQPQIPQNLSLLEEAKKKERIIEVLDKINDKYGEFTLQRGILLTSPSMQRKPNPFLSDRRFRL